LIWVGIAVGLVLLTVYLRFVNLSDNPGWDGDEGYNLNIAANLAAGRLQMFGMRYAFVQHPPLFYLLSAVLMRIWTHDLIALRALAATSGTLTIVAVYALGTRLRGRGLGLAAATFLIIWPLAVVQQRWAYTYNLLELLVPLSFWIALSDATPARPAAERSVPLLQRYAVPAGAGLIAGLALATDQEAIALVPALALLLRPRGGLAVLTAAAGAAIAPLTYIIWMLLVRRSDFLFDVRHSATRLDVGPGTLAARFVDLLQSEPLIAVGLIGILFTGRGPARHALVALTAVLLLIVLAVRDPSPYFRAAEPLVPLIAIGVGTVLLGCRGLLSFLLVPEVDPDHGVTQLPRRARQRATFAYAVLLMPFVLTMGVGDVAAARGHFKTGIDPLLPRSAAGARAMAAWVNRRVAPSSLVIVMPEESWLIDCRTADLLQAVAIHGEGTAFYPAGLQRSRFVYDTSLTAAKFLVVDDYTRAFDAENYPERALTLFAQSHWRIAYRAGEYAIYANPRPPEI
jgi:4-amino-4-deoxy-L-arabinose transferase-like glycosyltransferase